MLSLVAVPLSMFYAVLRVLFCDHEVLLFSELTEAILSVMSDFLPLFFCCVQEYIAGLPKMQKLKVKETISKFFPYQY